MLTFSRETYMERRAALAAALREKGEDGLVLFVGNVDACAQLKAECYRFRQDSSWLYYFGLDEPGLAATIDLSSGAETLYADDVTEDDIIWIGPQMSVAEKAFEAGVAAHEPASGLDKAVAGALASGRKVLFLPPSRYYNTMRLMELLGLSKEEVAAGSLPLIEAVVKMRLVKTPEEIALIDAACDLGYEMHSTGRDLIRPGVVEGDIVDKMDFIATSKGWGVSFGTIFTQHGEIFHNPSHDKTIEPGRLIVVDAGVEAKSHYASDFTRTYPSGGKFTAKQREIYEIALAAHEKAFSMTAPGIAYRDVHLAAEAVILEGLASVGIVRGDVPEMVAEGIGGLFLPHGLGHNMGLDVHDMEDLGEDHVGYDPDQKRASRLGLRSLRMARRLVPGNVITDEPGIYFNVGLIESWRRSGKGSAFINYDLLEKEYYDFGGIRIEDDVLVTPTGARRLGSRRLPVTVPEIESLMQNS